MNTELAAIPQPVQKDTVLPSEIHEAVQKWSNSFFRPSIPTNLIEKSVVTEINDERAKLLTAVYLYGVREGTRKEIPYNDGDISNRTDNLNEESLWLYGRRYAHAPTVFSPVKLPSFNISTGETHKCSKCRGEGKVDCWGCKGTGQDKSQTCRHCTGKGCRYCNGTGKAVKDCPFCKGIGTKTCGKCDGYKYVQVVIEVETSYKVENSKEHDYQGEVPPKKLKKTTGAAVFEEVASYPSEGMREMLIGGLDRQEYAKLQSGVAKVFHSLVDNKIQNYDGNLKLVHDLVDNFFKQIPNAFQENRVLKREILPVRLKIKVEDVPVKKVSYTYKDKAYTLWIYGKENKIYSGKRPFGFTGRLLVSWIIQIIIVGLVVYWLTGPHTQQAQENQTPVEAATGNATPTNADLYENNLKAAQQGNPEAETKLGLMYAKGDGVVKNPDEAVKWFTQAAEQGFARAQNNLGLMYDAGNGVAKDPAEALKWFTKAAEQEFPEAQNNLGSMYGDGDGVTKDPVEARKWFEKAAVQGNALAQKNLGLIYANGDGVAQDPTEAVKWFTKAAAQGFANAQNNLGIMYEDGNGVAKDDVEAVKWFRAAAEQGFARAQNSLATKYLDGEGVAKDPVAARKWFEKSAEQGFPDGQYNLGTMYDNGDGITKDPVEAVKWYRKAAEQGFARAESSLAADLFNGEGVAKDPVEAVKWFEKAAEQGLAGAQYNLGQLYNAGTGVPMDYVQAAKWFYLAASQGNADAKNAYSKLSEIMSPEKISQAQASAKEFVPKTSDQ